MPGQIYPSGGSVYLKFTTRAFSTGIPTTLAGSPVVSIYKDDSLTQSTAGVTLTVDFDSVTGLNHVTIDTTADATFYANGHTFYLVITTGTVSSVSVVGEAVGNFDLAAAVVTAGNTLAVDGSGRVDVGKILGTASQGTAGYVGLDWGHITAPTTTVGLTNTTISSSQVVASVTGAVGSVTGAVGSVTGAVGSVTGNVGGNVVGTVASVVGAVGSVTGNVGGNVTGTVASVVGNVGGNVVGTVASVVGAVGSVTGAVGSVTGNVGGNVVGTVASVVGNVGGNVTGSVGSVVGAVGSVTAIVTANTTQIEGVDATDTLDARIAAGLTLYGVSTYAGGAVSSVTGNVGGNVAGTVGGLTAAGMALFFTTNTTKVYADAVDGSVIKEIASNAGGGGSDPNVILSGTLGSQSLGDVDFIVLPSGPSDNGVLAGSRLRITSGVAQYQERTITVWNGTDKIAGIDETFTSTPTAGDSFEVIYDHSYQLDGGNVLGYVQVFGLDAGALSQFFTVDSGQVYAGAVAGSVVKETAGNATVSGTVDANIVEIGGVAAGDDVEQTGVATTFFGRLRQLYNRFFPEGPSGEVVKNSGTHTIVTKDSTGTPTLTQNFTDDGHGNETIGPPS